MKRVHEVAADAASDRERCTICGRITDVPRGRPIALREYYVVGSGQLCRECYFCTYRRTGTVIEDEVARELLTVHDGAEK